MARGPAGYQRKALQQGLSPLSWDESCRVAGAHPKASHSGGPNGSRHSRHNGTRCRGPPNKVERAFRRHQAVPKQRTAVALGGAPALEPEPGDEALASSSSRLQRTLQSGRSGTLVVSPGWREPT